MLKVRDLLELECAGDVIEDIADRVAIYYEFVGTELTPAGEARFKEALEFPVKRIKNDTIIIGTVSYIEDNNINIVGFSFEGDDIPPCIKELEDLFRALAGYVSDSDAKLWFK